MKACIVGLGETGKAITALLVTTFKSTSFTILDPSEHISGRILDLQHAASFNFNTIHINDFKKASNADYIFFCAGVRNQKGASRESTAKTNKALINNVFEQFTPKSSAKIIVVTNPVELITEWISEYFNHTITVVGTGTALDKYRLHWLIHEHTQQPLEKINVDVIGEHGNGMTPIYSQGNIGDQSVSSIIQPEELNEITKALKNAAKTIRITEEATSYGVAQCALEILKAFEHEKPTRFPISIQITEAYKKLLSLEADIFISLPCSISLKGIVPLAPITMNEQELSELKQAAEHILGIDREMRV